MPECRRIFFTIDMQNAYEQLGLIIGETIEDDIVDKIFKRFFVWENKLFGGIQEYESGI